MTIIKGVTLEPCLNTLHAGVRIVWLNAQGRTYIGHPIYCAAIKSNICLATCSLLLQSRTQMSLFDKNVTRMLQQEGILGVLKNRPKMCCNFLTSCYYYCKSTKACCTIIATFFRVCRGVIHVKNHLDRWLFVKTLRSDKSSSEQSKLD